MSTTATATRKPAPRKPAATKPQPAAKAAASKEQKPAAKPAAPAKAKPEPKPEAKTLVGALSTGQATLVKVRANNTRRSLPYLAKGSETRVIAEGVVARRERGDTIEQIAEDMSVSVATVRRYVSGLALAQDVEAGKFNGLWREGTREVVVHVVTAKQA